MVSGIPQGSWNASPKVKRDKFTSTAFNCICFVSVQQQKCLALREGARCTCDQYEAHPLTMSSQHPTWRSFPWDCPHKAQLRVVHIPSPIKNKLSLSCGKKGQRGFPEQGGLLVEGGRTGAPCRGPWLVVTYQAHRPQERRCQKQKDHASCGGPAVIWTRV